MLLTEEMAERLRAVERIPKDTQAVVIKCVLDAMTASIAGYTTANARAVRAVATTIWGEGQSSVWFADCTPLTASGAAFANAAAMCSLDLDDGHRKAAGHPGAAIIPALFAVAQGRDWTGERLLTAIAIGYEVGVRISASRDLNKVSTTNTGRWAGQAVAAAVAWLDGYSAPKIAHAIAIAGNTAPNQGATAYTRFRGNNVKEGIPWGAANGILAAQLANQGFTGPIDLLDEPSRYRAETLTEGLGAMWQIEGTYFKPYSCCRWIHAAVDAVLAMIAEYRIESSDIVAIDVDTFSRTLTLSNEIAPSTLESAQYSMPFCVALAAVLGKSALLPVTEDVLGNTEVLNLAARVRTTACAEFDAMFPEATPARVRLYTTTARLERTVLTPKGEPTNPMRWHDIEVKFRAVSSDRLGRHNATAVLNAISALKDGDARPLFRGLAYEWRMA